MICLEIDFLISKLFPLSELRIGIAPSPLGVNQDLEAGPILELNLRKTDIRNQKVIHRRDLDLEKRRRKLEN